MTSEQFISEAPEPNLSTIIGADAVGGPTPWGIHRWRDLLRCPRRYYYRYEMRLIAPGSPSDAIEFGSLMHELLALYYRRESPRDLITQIRDEGYKPDLVADVIRVMRAYTEKYPKKKDPYYKGVKYKSWIERYIEVVPISKTRGGLTTRVDVIYKPKGGIVIVDHKTSNAMTSQLTSAYMFDPQMLGMAAGAMLDRKLRRHRVLRIEINAIVRTKVPQFTRAKHALNKYLVEQFLDDFERWRGYLLDCRSRDWPRTYECISKYRSTCEYRGACMTGSAEGLVEAEEGRIL